MNIAFSLLVTAWESSQTNPCYRKFLCYLKTILAVNTSSWYSFLVYIMTLVAIVFFIFDSVFGSIAAYDISIFPWFLKEARSQGGRGGGRTPHLPALNMFSVPKSENISHFWCYRLRLQVWWIFGLIIFNWKKLHTTTFIRKLYN